MWKKCKNSKSLLKKKLISNTKRNTHVPIVNFFGFLYSAVLVHFGSRCHYLVAYHTSVLENYVWNNLISALDWYNLPEFFNHLWATFYIELFIVADYSLGKHVNTTFLKYKLRLPAIMPLCRHMYYAHILCPTILLPIFCFIKMH